MSAANPEWTAEVTARMRTVGQRAERVYGRLEPAAVMKDTDAIACCLEQIVIFCEWVSPPLGKEGGAKNPTKRDEANAIRGKVVKTNDLGTAIDLLEQAVRLYCGSVLFRSEDEKLLVHEAHQLIIQCRRLARVQP